MRRTLSSLKDFEDFLGTFYGKLPKPPARFIRALVQFLPLVSLVTGIYFIVIAVLPLIIAQLPIDPLRGSELININIALLRLLFALIGIILLTSYTPLKKLDLSAWNRLFTLSVLIALIVIMLLNAVLLAALLLYWYVLFIVKPQFS